MNKVLKNVFIALIMVIIAFELAVFAVYVMKLSISHSINELSEERMFYHECINECGEVIIFISAETDCIGEGMKNNIKEVDNGK